MANWSNWSGRLTAAPRTVIDVTDVDDFVVAVAEAERLGQPVRAVGTSHSHSPVAVTDGVMVTTDRWSGLLGSTAGEHPTATVRSGTKIHDIGPSLYRAGLGLLNQGDIDRQSIAGAVSTGTHGTGVDLGGFSSAIRSVGVVLAGGELVRASVDSEPDLFSIIRLSLGAVGLLVDVELEVAPRYRLHERLWSAGPDDVMGDITGLTEATRHFEFFWVPQRDLCACKSLDRVPDSAGASDMEDVDVGRAVAEPAIEQLSERERRGYSHRIFPSVRDDRHTEMEYSVPAHAGPACFGEIRIMIKRRFPDLQWPVEYRTQAADDVLLSPARSRPTVTISVHQDIALDDRALFEAAEAIFLRHDGRPHWGKVHYLDGPALADRHAGYRRWWELRDRFDPGGLFVTPALERWRP